MVAKGGKLRMLYIWTRFLADENKSDEADKSRAGPGCGNYPMRYFQGQQVHHQRCMPAQFYLLP